MFTAYEVAQKGLALAYALERLDHARKHETRVAAVRWMFRVDAARRAFEKAQRAVVIDAVGELVAS